MAPERVTITVESPFGADGPLTVGDALRQVIELFDLFVAAQGENEDTVSWRLVSISKNSPLEAVGEPFASVPGVDVDTIARGAKWAVHQALDDITSDAGVPSWMDSNARGTVRSILERNTNGIGRTNIKFDDVSPATILVPRLANVGLSTLRKAEAEITANEPNLSRSQIGSIQGFVADATTFYKQPALRIRDRRTGAEVLCVFTHEAAERAGGNSWQKVWRGARVRVYGRIDYNRKGLPSTVAADDVIEITPRDLEYEDIVDTNFTGGLTIAEYLAQDAEVG
jgi:hypothetical protein